MWTLDSNFQKYHRWENFELKKWPLKEIWISKNTIVENFWIKKIRPLERKKMNLNNMTLGKKNQIKKIWLLKEIIKKLKTK